MEATFVETDFGVESKIVLAAEEADCLVDWLQTKRGSEHYSYCKRCPTWESDSVSAIQFGGHFMLSANDQANHRYYYEVDQGSLRDLCSAIKQTVFSKVKLRLDPCGIFDWELVA